MGAAGRKGRAVVEDVLVVAGPHPDRFGEGIEAVPEVEDPLFKVRKAHGRGNAGEIGAGGHERGMVEGPETASPSGVWR